MSSVIAASAVCKSALPYIKPVLATDGPAITFPQGDEPVALDLENDLLVMYLVDRGTHFAYIQSKDLAAEKLSTSELHELALKNLGALASDRLRVQKHSRVYVPLLDGNFEASLLLLESFWEQSLSQYAQDFVAAVPSRDVLAFCDAGDLAGVEELRDVVSRVFPGGDHTISERLYRRVRRRWVPHDA